MLLEHPNAVRRIYYTMWDSICCMFYCTNLCRKKYRGGHEFLQHLQGLKVFCCSGIPRAWLKTHMYRTNEMDPLNSWFIFDFPCEDTGVHYRSLHVGVTPAASHLRHTAAPQVTELIARFHPQHESRLMTSSTLPSLAFVWNGTHREIRGKWHVQASLCTPQTRSLPLPLKVAAINFSCPLCSH